MGVGFVGVATVCVSEEGCWPVTAGDSFITADSTDVFGIGAGVTVMTGAPGLETAVDDAVSVFVAGCSDFAVVLAKAGEVALVVCEFDEVDVAEVDVSGFTTGAGAAVVIGLGATGVTTGIEED